MEQCPYDEPTTCSNIHADCSGCRFFYPKQHPEHGQSEALIFRRDYTKRKQSMSDVVIKPTIGRVVWFKAGGCDQMHPALVCYVHSDECVNLSVSDQNGNQYGQTSILLFHGDADECPVGQCCWMPYQKQQAEKAEQAEEETTA